MGAQSFGAHNVGSRLDSVVCVDTVEAIFERDAIACCCIGRAGRVRCNERSEPKIIEYVAVE